MAGNINSGRRTVFDEKLRNRVLDKCWSFLEEYINDETISRKERADVAKVLASRSVPQQVQGTLAVTMMPFIKVGDQPMEYNVGTPATTGDAPDAGQAPSISS